MNGGTRRLLTPYGDGSLAREVEANEELRQVVELCHLAAKSRVYFSIENPSNSYILYTHEIKQLLKLTNAQVFVFDQCCYGLNFPDSQSHEFCKKPTAIITNMPGLAKISRRCPGISNQHKHVYAWGAMKASDVPFGSSLKRAAAAGTYPAALCNEWASLVVNSLAEGEPPIPPSSPSH